MIVYNITIKVARGIEKEWVKWQKEERIPDVMKTGLFNDYKFYKLLEQDESEGITYVVQYFASTVSNYQEYLDKFAPLLRDKAFAKWGNNFIAFRTILQVVN